MHGSSQELSFFSERAKKRQKLGWATTSGATLRAHMVNKQFKFHSISRGLTSSVSMTALPSRQPLANISNFVNGNLVLMNPTTSVKDGTALKGVSQASPARAKVVVGIVKTPSAPNMKGPETPKSVATARKTPGGRMNALRQLAATPKRLLFAAVSNSDDKENVDSTVSGNVLRSDQIGHDIN